MTAIRARNAPFRISGFGALDMSCFGSVTLHIWSAIRVTKVREHAARQTKGFANCSTVRTGTVWFGKIKFHVADSNEHVYLISKSYTVQESHTSNYVPTQNAFVADRFLTQPQQLRVRTAVPRPGTVWRQQNLLNVRPQVTDRVTLCTAVWWGPVRVSLCSTNSSTVQF